MKFILEHLKTQTIPYDMLEELQNAQVRFYEGCLIVQVQDHRTNSGTSSSTSTSTSKSDKNIPFSIHNYNEHLTPSPYVPYPQKEDAMAESDKNKDASQADSTTNSNGKQAEKGPKIFTVVLFPTPLSLHEEVYIQANTVDPRNNRKQSIAVPRTPASATVPATPLSTVPPTPFASGPPPLKKVKMSISGSEIHGFESKAISTTAPPLFLDPVDNIEDTFKVLGTLTDPRHKEHHPAPKARKRTEAELAADEAIAAQEQEFMLIMDERHGASGAAGVKAGTTDGDAGGTTFEPRFETWQAIKNIRAEHKDRAEREAIEKAQKEAQAAENKRRMEQQERLNREQTESRAAQVAQEQQSLRKLHRQQQMTLDLQAREARRQQQLAVQNQPAHGHPLPNGISQAQNSSPVVRNVTPHNNSSPLVNNIHMNGQVTSSPPRPTSAMQHGHVGGVPMAQQRSRQRAPSRTSTPQMNGTPSMQQATPRVPQGSPPMSMASNPVMSHNVIANHHLNGPPPQLSQQQQMEILARRHQQHQYQQQQHQMQQQQQQQRMQNGSPNPQISPDRNPGHMQTLHQQAQLNQQRQQQQEYQRSLAMHHQALGNGAGHPNIPNGTSPRQQHTQQHSQQQANPVLNPMQQQYLRDQIRKAHLMLMQQCAQKYGGNPQNIPMPEQNMLKQKAQQMGNEQFRRAMQQKQQHAQQLHHMQQMQQMQGMSGMNVPGGIMGGRPVTEEQARAFQGMTQFSQMPHMGGAGVQNMNGAQKNPHMNGGGMGGMQ